MASVGRTLLACAAFPLAAVAVGLGGSGCNDLVLAAEEGDGGSGEGDGDGGNLPPLDCPPGRAYPSELGCTGLYSDWPKADDRRLR